MILPDGRTKVRQANRMPLGVDGLYFALWCPCQFRAKFRCCCNRVRFFVSFDLLVAAEVLDLPIRQCTESDLAKPEKS